MKKIIILTILLLSGVAGCRQQSGTLHLTKNGKSDYTIVIPQYPSGEELRAAEFLKDHVADGGQVHGGGERLAQPRVGGPPVAEVNGEQLNRLRGPYPPRSARFARATR